MTYIPSLRLYYDESTESYYNEMGYMIDVLKHNKRHTDQPNMWSNPPDIAIPEQYKSKSAFSMENMHLSATSVFQIVAICVAITTQYNLIENKINQVDYKLENLKVMIAEKDANIQSLHQELTQIKAKVDINDKSIDNLEFRISNVSTRK